METSFQEGESAVDKKCKLRIILNLARLDAIVEARLTLKWVEMFMSTCSAFDPHFVAMKNRKTTENVEVATASFQLSACTLKRILHSHFEFHPYQIMIVWELFPHDFHMIFKKYYCFSMKKHNFIYPALGF